MFGIFRKRQPAAQAAAQLNAQQPTLQTNQLHHLDQASRAPAGNTILTNGAPADATATAMLALFIHQHQDPDIQLLAKADRLTRLQARPLGWSNTLPVVVRPEPDELAHLRAAHDTHTEHAAPSVSPAPVPGTPPWHPQAE
jgi:hypothetical protein